MKALILVGGFGTRLRPLTLKIPKPLVPFCNMPIVEHQIAALEKVGVDEVVLAINYKPEHMQSFVERMKTEHPNMTIHCSQEKTPLGTAGPIRLAQEVLRKNGDGVDSDEPFFVLNSDVICSFPLDDFVKQHNANAAKGALGTIMVTKVEEPSKYGVVVFDDESGRISSFVEKPQTFVGNKINAGIYILNPSVMDTTFFPKEGESASIEKQVFPQMADRDQLYAFVLPGFWMDVGQPRDYLTGMERYLEFLQEQNSDKLATGESFNERVIVSDSAKIAAHCAIGPDVVIGPDCVIEDGVRLRRCVVMEGAHIKAHSWVHSSIVGWHSVVGSWCRVEGTSVLGEDVKIKDELYINGGTILPNKTIKESINEPRIVM